MRLTALPWVVKRRVDLTQFSLRRMTFIARTRTHAFWQRSTVDIDLARDVKLGRGVRATIDTRTHNVLRVGPNCTIGDRVLLVLKGGRIEMADWVEIRRDVVLTVAGRLSFGGHNTLQPAVGIHCDESVVIGRMVGIGERTTIVDSAHFFTGPDDWMADNLKTAPIEIGYHAWIGAKATIGKNVTIGDHSVVAANALVLDDVPEGHLASGVPAVVVRPVRRPWVEGNGAGDGAD